MTTRRNHYVPVWYQKGFTQAEDRQLYYLDMETEGASRAERPPNDAPIPRRRPPQQCFWSQDLYTTTFGNAPNDDIERFLFGMIDNDGANAVRAVASGDLAKIHELFMQFFEYLDAQKMRTPKGLDWIKDQYPKLTQLELMQEMQQLRQMHCTMWLEAVREIVSAEDSEVKFIITDHPITIYNPLCQPDSELCRYPHDPAIDLIGSQTIFALDANHCLILTNLERAQNPGRTDLLECRQNARHFGQTLARTDALIRSRKLSEREVLGINTVLKARAHRYISAAKEAWLYPAVHPPMDWASIEQILLPPSCELWHFGGEMYVGYEDGTSAYQDAFGRTSRAHEYLRKNALVGPPAPQGACLCGSGRTYERCCRDLSGEERMPWDVFSIRERNLMFFHAMEDIMGLSRGKSWRDVQRELSDEQVRKIHQAYASLWPQDTQIVELLPRPDERVFRALYVGLVDPRTILVSVVALLPYFDQIWIISPFVNANAMKPQYSPVDSPAQYKEQTLKNAYLLGMLAPLIGAGVVNLVPDPAEFSFDLRREILAIGKEKADRLVPSPDDYAVFEELGRDDFKRMLARLPEESLERQVRRVSPELKAGDIQKAIAYMKAELEEDPFALLQPLMPGKEHGQLMQLRGLNFELALFLAQLTGAALYSDQILTGTELEYARLLPDATAGHATDPTAQFEIGAVTDPDQVMVQRRSEESKAFRRALRTLWNAGVGALVRPAEDTAGVAVRVRELETLQVPQPPEGPEPADLTLHMDIVVPPRGYGLNTVRRLLIAYGRVKRLAAIPLAILIGRAANSSGTGVKARPRR